MARIYFIISRGYPVGTERPRGVLERKDVP